jgi:hypothetical protein
MTYVVDNEPWISYKIIEENSTSTKKYRLTLYNSIGTMTQGISVSNSDVRNYLTWNHEKIFKPGSSQAINLFETNREIIIQFNGDGTVTFDIYNSNPTSSPFTLTSTGTSIYYYAFITGFVPHYVNVAVLDDPEQHSEPEPEPKLDPDP